MKKIFTLLWLTLTVFSFNASAQNTVCNAEFSVQYITNANVKFNPVITAGAPTYQHIWNFGDGSPASNVVSPTHTFTLPGTYTTVHTIIRYNQNNIPECTQSFTRTVIIAPGCNLVVDFSWTATATNPLRIEFHNLSAPIATNDSIRWTFGDGSSSSEINPVHTYNASGTYTVCLRIIRYNTGSTTPCIRDICKTVVVTQPCNLVINFSSQPDPAHPLRIKFTNLSNPVSPSDSVRWTFGDGTVLNGLQSNPNIANPTHDYANAGTYTVCLRIKKNNSTTPNICVRDICRTIIVTQPCNFHAAFIWRLDSSNHKKVYFTNQTAAPTAAATATWTFGDGSSATTWNAIHEYAQPGTYRVCLRVVAAPNCVSEICDTVIIPNAPPACTQLSKFHFEKFSNDNQQYKFTPDYLNTTLQYTWTFGDGTGSHNPIAIHRYAQPGVYTACLTVWRGPDCASTTCHEIRVQPQINCDSIQVTYNYQRDSQVPNKISFYAVSSLPILDQVWTITRLPVSTTNTQVVLHQSNPVYLFQDTGLYRVCVRAITLGGCVKEFCREIRIEHIANGCMLQAYPNPTSNIINVSVQLTQPELIHAFMYNSMNMLIRDKQQQGHTGSNIVSFAVNDLPAGQYTIKLVYGNNICYARFTKL